MLNDESLHQFERLRVLKVFEWHKVFCKDKLRGNVTFQRLNPSYAFSFCNCYFGSTLFMNTNFKCALMSNKLSFYHLDKSACTLCTLWRLLCF